jgi:hypothetical protein
LAGGAALILAPCLNGLSRRSLPLSRSGGVCTSCFHASRMIWHALEFLPVGAEQPYCLNRI